MSIRQQVARYWCRFAAHLGRRGGFLLLFGLTYVLIGYALLAAPVPVARAPLLHELLPIWLRMTFWTASGLVALCCAWTQTPGRDSPGFVVLCLLPAERAVSYAAGWLTSIISPGEGYPSGWSAACVWILLAGTIMLVSSWPEPPPRGAVQCAAAEVRP